MFGRKGLENDFGETIMTGFEGGFIFFRILDDQSMAERVLGSTEDYWTCSSRLCRKGFKQEDAY